MHDSPVKIHNLVLAFLFSLIIIVCVFLSSYLDKTTKIVFCDVGQGDAAYLRIRNKIDVLIDAGPDRKVLNCLGRYMPFWDRKIELIFISHNQKDHFGGTEYILNRYQVGTIYLVNDINISLKSFKKLKEKIIYKKIPIEIESAGKIIKVLNDKITIMWPIKGLISYNDNDFSSVLLFEEHKSRVLFTGDASPRVLNSLCVGNRHACSLQKTNILKIPHHGSKNGLTKKFLDLADPEVAVISVGKNNSYGHPSKEVLDMLESAKVKIKRTDINGDIIFKVK